MKRSLICILLIFTMLLSTGINASAVGLNDSKGIVASERLSNKKEVKFNRINTQAVAEGLTKSDSIRNVVYNGNTLSFEYADGKAVQVIEEQVTDNITTYYITEGNRSDVLTFDYEHNTATLNGEPFLTNSMVESIPEKKSLSKGLVSVNWEYAALGYYWNGNGSWNSYSTTLNDEIRYQTSTIVMYAILSLCASVWVADLVNNCASLITTYANQNSNSKNLLFKRRMYLDAVAGTYHVLERVVYYRVQWSFVMYETNKDSWEL